MNRTRVFTITIATLLGFLAGPLAWADPVTDCISKVDGISITGVNNEDTATLADLTAKQEAASLALVQNDFSAAKAELEVLQAKGMELSQGSTPSISLEDAKTLLQDVGSALSCVQSFLSKVDGLIPLLTA